jgi:hypothetical protein
MMSTKENFIGMIIDIFLPGFGLVITGLLLCNRVNLTKNDNYEIYKIMLIGIIIIFFNIFSIGTLHIFLEIFCILYHILYLDSQIKQ